MKRLLKSGGEAVIYRESERPYDEAGRVIALVPAHNEAALISETVASLFAQTRRPDRVIVVADNCTDDTPELAREAGAEVFFTRNNRDRKAGGLNQVLAEILSSLTYGDYVLVMDGDSKLAPRFVEVALSNMAPDTGAVGGIFLAASTSNLIERLQNNEYLRYSREIARSRKQAKVITGTGALFRAAALKDVIEARRSGIIPGGRAQVYDTLALTEDNELTLALKTLGWRCVSPVECLVMTDVMPSWGKLWSQRMRWQRGALENLKAYGLTKTTAPYIAKQVFMGVGAIAVLLLLTMTLFSALTGHFALQPFWAAVGGIFLVERIVTVWRGGAVPVAIASVLVIEFAYDLVQQGVYFKSLLDIVLERKASWGGNHAGIEETV